MNKQTNYSAQVPPPSESHLTEVISAKTKRTEKEFEKKKLKYASGAQRK